MKAKTYEQMSKPELIERIRAKDAVIDRANLTNVELTKEFRAEQEVRNRLEELLKRERVERNNYFDAFQKTLNIAENLAQKVSE